MTIGRGAAALVAAWLAMPVACLAGVTVENTNGAVATVARVPLWDRLSLTAHVGMVPNRTGLEDSQPLWLGGAGLEYRITRKLVLGAGWEHHARAGNPNTIERGLDARQQPGALDPDRVTIGLSYRF